MDRTFQARRVVSPRLEARNIRHLFVPSLAVTHVHSPNVFVVGARLQQDSLIYVTLPECHCQNSTHGIFATCLKAPQSHFRCLFTEHLRLFYKLYNYTNYCFFVLNLMCIIDTCILRRCMHRMVY